MNKLCPKLNEEIKVYDLINDTFKRYLWGLRFIQLEKTWGEVEEQELKKIRIALIDSGIDVNHEDLKYTNILPGYNFIDDNNDISDSYYHGTSVAGVIAAQKNNNIGIAGVACGVTILPLKVIDKEGKANIQDVINAIEYAIDNNVNIINLSMGYQKGVAGILNNSNVLLDKEYQLLKKAIERNIIIVSSVGNNAGLPMDFPASMDDVISVASYGIIRIPLKVYWSNRNSEPDDKTIFAPGEAIMTTLPNNNYWYTSGASIATAFVTGSVALIKARYPNISPKQLQEILINKSDTLFYKTKKMRLLNVDRTFFSLSKMQCNQNN